MGYSPEEKSNIVRSFYSNGSNWRNARLQYSIEYPMMPLPSKSTILYIVKQFQDRNSFERKKRSFVRNTEEDMNVLLFFKGKF